MKLPTRLFDDYYITLKANDNTKTVLGRSILLRWVLQDLPEETVYEGVTPRSFCENLIIRLENMGVIVSDNITDEALIVLAKRLLTDAESSEQLEQIARCRLLLKNLQEEKERQTQEQQQKLRLELETQAQQGAAQVAPALICLRRQETNAVVGIGFVVQDTQKNRRVLTGARAVCAALGIAPSAARPQGKVTLTFACDRAHPPVQAAIVEWRYAPETGDDAATLDLDAWPDACEPLPLQIPSSLYGHYVHAIGARFPQETILPLLTGKITDKLSHTSWLSLEIVPSPDAEDMEQLCQWLPGCPLWSPQAGQGGESGVAGMATMGYDDAGRKVIQMIPTQKLAEALNTPRPETSVSSRPEPYQDRPVEAMVVRDPFNRDLRDYIRRPEEEKVALKHIGEGRQVVLTGPLHIGKSMLLRYLINKTQESNTLATQTLKTVLVKIQGDFLNIAASKREFYRLLAKEIARAVAPRETRQHKKKVEEIIAGDREEVSELTQLMEEYILPRVEGKLLLAFEGIESLWERKFLDELFPMFKIWATDAAAAEPPWDRLLIVLEVSRNPALLTPRPQAYNHVDAIEVKEFNEEQVRECMQRYQVAWDDDDIRTVLEQLGGHPYMVRKTMYKARAANPHKSARAVLTDNRCADLFSDHFLPLTSRILQANLLQELCRLVQNPAYKMEEDTLQRLLDSGVIKKNRAGFYELRYEIYRTCLGTLCQ